MACLGCNRQRRCELQSTVEQVWVMHDTLFDGAYAREGCSIISHLDTVPTIPHQLHSGLSSINRVICPSAQMTMTIDSSRQQ